MNEADVAKAFPEGIDTETDNLYGAMVNIAACFILLDRRDKEIGPKYMAVLRQRMADPAKVEELRKMVLSIASEFRSSADAMLDAAITLDIALLDRAAAEKNVC